jgi:hypothetical protein
MGKWTVVAAPLVALLLGASPSAGLLRADDMGPRPPQIVSVTPAEDGLACSTPVVGARLSLADVARQDGGGDPGALGLALDGADVTAQSYILGTMDSPQSRVDLRFRPATPLPPGHHTAAISFPDAAGETQMYVWGFEVQGNPCPPQSSGSPLDPGGAAACVSPAPPAGGPARPSTTAPPSAVGPSDSAAHSAAACAPPQTGPAEASPAPGSTAPAAPVSGPPGGPSHDAVVRYWTPERMADAQPARPAVPRPSPRP